MKDVFAEFPEAFQEPQGLRPTRQHGHAFILKEGATVPNIRTYIIFIIEKMN